MIASLLIQAPLTAWAQPGGSGSNGSSLVSGVSDATVARLLQKSMVAMVLVDPSESLKATRELSKAQAAFGSAKHHNLIVGNGSLMAATTSGLLGIWVIVDGLKNPVEAGRAFFPPSTVGASSLISATGFALSAFSAIQQEKASAVLQAQARAALIQAIRSDVRLYGDLLGKSASEQNQMVEFLQRMIERLRSEQAFDLVQVLHYEKWITDDQARALQATQALMSKLSSAPKSTRSLDLKTQLDSVKSALSQFIQSPAVSSRQKETISYLMKSIEILNP